MNHWDRLLTERLAAIARKREARRRRALAFAVFSAGVLAACAMLLAGGCTL